MASPRPSVVFLLGCLSWLPAQNGVEVVEPELKAPRGKVLEWKSAQGKTYWYRLPKEIEPKVPPDLVLMLHGTGLDHRWSFANYPVAGEFRKRDIVVSPDGVTPGHGETFNFVQGPKDGEQIVGLIRDFKQRFPIGRVYLYGHSQGAFFCYWFAGEHPELIDGIVAHAGNVLDVKHGKLAKQKVAIGILHGRADAVVPVECAVRTEQIYREQGYEKLKLEIVDGLTEQSGHWPLPVQVAAMLEWLDQVSTLSAVQAVRSAASELQKAWPDLAVVAEQMAVARKLMAKAAEADKKVLPAQLDAIGKLIDRLALLHAEALLKEPAVSDPKAGYGAWATEFGLLDRAFAEHAGWKKAMSKPRDLAQKHDKLLEKAQKGLGKPSKDSRAAAVKALEDAFLARAADGMHGGLAKAVADAAEDELAQRLQALQKTRQEDRQAAKQAIALRQQGAIDELKTAWPELFPAAAADGK
ncbi:MAG: alpha/beta fold hydrolase [Planctomycetes bacterium]|nr:alpha/beta fold hydrolase [Planctomycetota bacterium]